MQLPDRDSAVDERGHLHGVVDRTRPSFIGERADEPARVSEKLRQNTFWQGRGGSVEHAISGIDIALWDLFGKITKQPVSRLLGGNYRSKIKPYGSLLFDEIFVSPKSSSYRAYRFAWSGHPTDRPALAATTAGATTTVYASWNGATEVARWRVLSGTAPSSLRAGPTAARTDFETAIPLGGAAKLVQVEALDRSGKVLGRSRVVAAKRA